MWRGRFCFFHFAQGKLSTLGQALKISSEDFPLPRLLPWERGHPEARSWALTAGVLLPGLPPSRAWMGRGAEGRSWGSGGGAGAWKVGVGWGWGIGIVPLQKRGHERSSDRALLSDLLWHSFPHTRPVTPEFESAALICGGKGSVLEWRVMVPH